MTSIDCTEDERLRSFAVWSRSRFGAAAPKEEGGQRDTVGPKSRGRRYLAVAGNCCLEAGGKFRSEAEINVLFAHVRAVARTVR